MTLSDGLSSLRRPGLALALLGLALATAARGEDAGTRAEDSRPAPVITRVQPNLIPPGDESRKLTIVGRNFLQGAAVYVGEQKIDQAVVRKEGTEIEIQLPKFDGEARVRVVNPDKRETAEIVNVFRGQGAQAVLFQTRESLRSLVYWINLGGRIMYPILFLSLVTFALFFHCLMAIRESHLIPKRLVEDVAEYLANGHWDNAAEYCRKKACAFGRVVLAGVQKADQPAEIIREAMSAAGARESEALQQKISYLNNIGVIAPMLGLFGTVWGLQLAFQGIAGEGAQHQVLAASISIALHTTVAGLFVGILAFVFYFLFRGKVVRLVSNMEILAEEMAERIIERKGEEE